MDIKRILGFLEAIRENNNREWFLENKKEYQAVRKIFEKDVEKLIERISLFDASISHITVKDATYRFNRDTRFHRTSRRTRGISGHISQLMARRLFTEGITYMLSLATVSWHVATIIFRQISLHRAVMR